MTDKMRSSLFARDEVKHLSLYEPDQRACTIDLSDNTNLWGAPPAACRALHNASGMQVARYPSPYGNLLAAPVLRYLELDRTPNVGVVTGCGSDDVIDATMRAFGAAGERVAYASPTFSMIPVFARLNGLVPVAVPLTAQFDLDAERLVDCGAKITYICAPNNPTGTRATRAAVEYVVSRARGIVLLDEAYAEFSAETFADLVGTSERVVVARTFSKAFGLAGLRVGVGIGDATLVDLIARARGPYKVNSMAEQAALAALSDDAGGLPWVREHALLATQLRERFSAALRLLGFSTIESSTNFVFVPTARATAIAALLSDAGIRVRAFIGLPREIPTLAACDGAGLRIGIGPWDAMQTVLDRLSTVVK